MVMGLSPIPSLSQACHDLEGSLARRETKSLSENPVVLPAGEKGRSNLFISARPRAALVGQIVLNVRRRTMPISSARLCATSKESLPP